MSLSGLLTNATPGPWRVVPAIHGSGAFVRAADDKTVARELRNDEVARLIAFCPETTQLLVATMGWLESHVWARYGEGSGWFCRFCSLDKHLGHAAECDAGLLLARFAALNQRAQALGGAEAATGQSPEQENTP